MQSTFIDITSYLQYCPADLLGCYVVMQAGSMLIDESAAPMIGLLILFFLVKHGKWSIACLL